MATLLRYTFVFTYKATLGILHQISKETPRVHLYILVTTLKDRRLGTVVHSRARRFKIYMQATCPPIFDRKELIKIATDVLRLSWTNRSSRSKPYSMDSINGITLGMRSFRLKRDALDLIKFFFYIHPIIHSRGWSSI